MEGDELMEVDCFRESRYVWEILPLCSDCGSKDAVVKELRLFITNDKKLVIVGKCSKCGGMSDDYMKFSDFQKLVHLVQEPHPILHLQCCMGAYLCSDAMIMDAVPLMLCDGVPHTGIEMREVEIPIQQPPPENSKE